MEARYRFKVCEQVVRFGDQVEDSGDLAGFHFLQSDRIVNEHRLDMDAQPAKHDGSRDGGPGAFGVKSDFFTFEVGEAPDLGPRIDMKLPLEKLGDIVNSLIDILGYPRLLILVENIRIGKRNVDALHVEQIAHIVRSPVCENGQNAEIVAVIERLANLGGHAKESPFQLPAGDTHCPLVDAGNLSALAGGGRVIATTLIGFGRRALQGLAA